MSDEFPSLIEQGKNLISSVQSIVSGDEFLANEVIQQDRMDVCRMCDRYSERRKRCKECGCFLEVKVKFASSECPLNKWKE